MEEHQKGYAPENVGSSSSGDEDDKITPPKGKLADQGNSGHFRDAPLLSTPVTESNASPISGKSRGRIWRVLGEMILGCIAGIGMAAIGLYLSLLVIPGRPHYTWLFFTPILGYILIARYIVSRRKVFGYAFGITAVILDILTTLIFFALEPFSDLV